MEYNMKIETHKGEMKTFTKHDTVNMISTHLGRRIVTGLVKGNSLFSYLTKYSTRATF